MIMDVDRIEIKKIIAQEITPKENVIVWSDFFISAMKNTLDEQVLTQNVEPEVAKTRLITYITDRLNNELDIEKY